MTQPSLLDLPPVRTKTRRHVPESSRLTYQAEHARLSKRATWVRRMLVDASEPMTAAELESFASFLDAPCFRRESMKDATARLLFVRRGLSDLQAAGVAEHAGMRRCQVSGSACQTWRLRER